MLKSLPELIAHFASCSGKSQLSFLWHVLAPESLVGSSVHPPVSAGTGVAPRGRGTWTPLPPLPHQQLRPLSLAHVSWPLSHSLHMVSSQVKCRMERRFYRWSLGEHPVATTPLSVLEALQTRGQDVQDLRPCNLAPQVFAPLDGG